MKKYYKRGLNIVVDAIMMGMFYVAFSQGEAVSDYVLNLLMFTYGLHVAIGWMMILATGTIQDNAVKRMSKVSSLPSAYRHTIVALEIMCLGALGWFWIAGLYFFGTAGVESLRSKAKKYKETGELPSDDSKKSDESES